MHSCASMGSSAMYQFIIPASIIPSVVLLLTNLISVVVAVLITRHCYRNITGGTYPSNNEDAYELQYLKKLLQYLVT